LKTQLWRFFGCTVVFKCNPVVFGYAEHNQPTTENTPKHNRSAIGYFCYLLGFQLINFFKELNFVGCIRLWAVVGFLGFLLSVAKNS